MQSRPITVRRLLYERHLDELLIPLRQAFLRTRIAAVGPVVARAIEEAGGRVSIVPSENFHMKPMVNEITAAFN
jgi:uroporphyrinogen-III synthase